MIINHINDTAKNTFGVDSEGFADHWFKTAENIHKEFVNVGLASTASFVREYIDSSMEYFVRRGKLPHGVQG